MNQHHSKLNQREQEQANQHQQSSGEVRVIEFASPEEALRHDAAQTPLPPRVAARLYESIQREPAPTEASWWRKMFGR